MYLPQHAGSVDILENKANTFDQWKEQLATSFVSIDPGGAAIVSSLVYFLLKVRCRPHVFLAVCIYPEHCPYFDFTVKGHYLGTEYRGSLFPVIDPIITFFSA